MLARMDWENANFDHNSILIKGENAHHTHDGDNGLGDDGYDDGHDDDTHDDDNGLHDHIHFHDIMSLL